MANTAPKKMDLHQLMFLFNHLLLVITMIVVYITSSVLGNVFSGSFDVGFIDILTSLADWIDSYPREARVLGGIINYGSKIAIPITAAVTVLNFLKKKKE